jgi:outer membrane protein OmpA-like peptidoglycan-associated protein
MFVQEAMMFRKIAVVLTVALFLAACASTDDPNKKAKRGAEIGAAAGAVAGAVIGNQSGNPRTGAAVGAAVGAGVGAGVGQRMDQQQKELEQIPGVQVQRTAENELNVTLKNDVLFDFDSAALRSASRRTLDDMATVFNRYPETQIAVDGYTDSVGRTEYNLNLSDHRAYAVKDYLVGGGLAASRVRARGFGEEHPKGSNDSAEGRQLNRRVEIHVVANQNQ